MDLVSFQQHLDFQSISRQHMGKLIVLIFHAAWNHSSLHFTQQVNTTIPLFGQFQNVVYIAVQAEYNPSLFKEFKVQYTPTVLFVDSFQNIIKKYEESDVSLIFDELAQQSQNYRVHFQKQKGLWRQTIRKQLDELDVVLLMKGNMQNTERYDNYEFINILKDNSVTFTFINILEKYKFAQWVQYFDGFSHYPQLYVKGKLLGSYSFCKQLHEKRQFLNRIPKDACQRPAHMIFEDLMKYNKCLVLVEGFAFQAKQANDEVSKLAAKYPDMMIYNVSFCKGLKEILAQKAKTSFPLLFVEGQCVEY